jgi:hypothetical protein
MDNKILCKIYLSNILKYIPKITIYNYIYIHIPTGHDLHCDDVMAPVTLEYDPAGQGLYILDPDGQ